MKKIIIELNKYYVVSHWWNMGRKTLDFSGYLGDLLLKKSIIVKKIKDKKNPNLDCYLFTTPHNITYKHFGDVLSGTFTVLKLFYATMGDKSMVNVCGRVFTINH